MMEEFKITGITKSEQLKKFIIEIIKKKKLKPGDSIFSENQLVKICHVSRITVGRAISELVSQKLLYRIQGKGTFVGKTPITKKANIGVVIPGTQGSNIESFLSPEFFYATIINSIESEVQKMGYHLFFSKDGRKESLNELGKKVDGLIFVDQIDKELVRLNKGRLPFLLVNCYAEGIDCVIPDDEEGAYMAIEHLAKLGHKKVGFILGPLEKYSTRMRMKGYKKALKEFGLEFNNRLVEEGDWEIKSGYQAMKKILKHRGAFTAVVSMNDRMATGAMQSAIEEGLVVPQDMSIVGFVDVELAHLSNPPLTTIRIPRKEMGIIAAQKLFERIEHKFKKPEVIKLPTQLVVRNSTAPPHQSQSA